MALGLIQAVRKAQQAAKPPIFGAWCAPRSTFLSLVAEVMPTQIAGADDRPIAIDFRWAPAATVGPQLEPEVEHCVAGFMASLDTSSEDAC
jgi:hypothetical protein